MHLSTNVFSQCKNVVMSNRKSTIQRLKTSAGQRKAAVKLVLTLSFIIAPIVTPLQAVAQDEEDWWFDVELIAFKRNVPSKQIEEDFSSTLLHSMQGEASAAKPTDLISLHLYQRANPLLGLQAMVYECTAAQTSFNSQLPALASPLINSPLTTSPLTPSLSIPADDIPFESPFARLLTSEERFSILLDPNNCSEQKEQIAKAFLSVQASNETPIYLQTPLIETQDQDHLLDDGQLALLDYAKKLFAQRDLKPLAHIAWRQAVVFGEEESAYYRVFAGKKLTLPPPAPADYDALKEKYDPELNQVIDQNSETFFAELKQQLNSAKKVNWVNEVANADNNQPVPSLDDVWELDGKVKVYLKYINRVPYLHIESEFQFHEIALDTFGEAAIEQYPFKQRRRIISKQIHYFDHPKIGIVIRLQRFEKPIEVENENIY